MARRIKSQRVRTSKLREDKTFASIHDALVDGLSAHGDGVRKEDVLAAAGATAWRSAVSWKKVVHWVTETPGVVILPLTWRYFASDRDKNAHSVDPAKYLAPNYSQAEGFADLVPFVEHSARNRQIALTKYSQQQLAAARALEKAERLNQAITSTMTPALRAP